MRRLERWFFPRGETLNFVIIACLSGAISLILIGRQIYRANWGLIDDHEVFYFLGPGLHLPLTDIWSTLLAKTEIGSLQGRFRPAYYTAKLIETSLWGANVHLWYLARTVGFAIFLSSIWWLLRRFVGIWLGGMLTLCIALLPLWAGIWSRLGTSEAYGAVCVGLMLYASYFLFFGTAVRSRNAGAIVLTLATVALVGMKETFLPFAGGTVAALLLAGIAKRLAPSVVAILMLAVFAAACGIVAVVVKEVRVSGADYYANSVQAWPVLVFAAKGVYFAVRQTWWICVAPILFYAALLKLSARPLAGWLTASAIVVLAYGFMIAMYAAQSALYRSNFPLNTRYDFPAMLLVPSSLGIAACYAFYLARDILSERTINYAQFAAAASICIGLAFGIGHPDKGKALAAAVRTNIEMTNAFYDELQLALGAAKKSPDSPIILEAYGPGAYEPVFSLSTYLPALGARNRISVRLHPEEKSEGKLYDGLQQELSDLEQAGGHGFTPLRESLARHPEDCISIGINGTPDAACSGFQVKTP